MAEDLSLIRESSADKTETSETDRIADRAVLVAIKQLETSTQFKQLRLDEIKKSEDSYYGRVKKPLKGRFNIPIPIMPGFIDTIVAKTDERVALTFDKKEEADYKKAIRITSMWKHDSSPQKGNWDRTDRGEKKLAALSGVGISKIWSHSLPHYKNNYIVVDYNDFHCEPLGGQNLENHLFLGQTNVLKTRYELLEGAKTGIYNKGQVAMLLNLRANGTDKKNTKLSEDRYNRFKAVGLDPESNTYVGQEIYNLTEWGMVFEGKRYYMLFDYSSGIWVRFQQLSDVFPVNKGEEELWPWTAWHTHEDPMLFWSKAPADDMRPIADMIRILANQELENRARRNAGQRAYDPSVYKNPEQFKWQPEGLVAGDASVKRLEDGIYEFETPELQGTINLVQWLDSMAGRKTGITSGAQGEAETDKVGINVLNLQQTADRLGLMNKAYIEAQIMKGVKYFRGLREHLPVGFAVEVMGENGTDWQELTNDDVKPIRDFDIKVSGGSSAIEADMKKREERKVGLSMILSDPVMRQHVNPVFATEEILRGSQWEDDEIQNLMDVANFGSREIVSEAAEENQRIFAGESVKPNVGATSRHLQKHIEFMINKQLSGKALKAMVEHLELEQPYVPENMARLGLQAAMAQPVQEQAGKKPRSPQGQDGSMRGLGYEGDFGRA